MILGSITFITLFYISAAASLIIVQYLSLGLPDPSIDTKYIGLILFILGISGNFYHHNLLSKLRNNNEKEYKIPRGGLFDLVICPHYLFEIIIFIGISFISRTSFMG
ncbi:putative 3-oxo-5-alpha-steroid 4-dehydrogenase (NADP(+)) [Helianthus anomalus]